jgi:hypothetical protein
MKNKNDRKSNNFYISHHPCIAVESQRYTFKEHRKMNEKIKVIANYLPQYHEIPENNKWWGKGFTDWVAVKNATALYEGHREPRIPLNGNYYDLSDVNNIRWQARLAKQYGVYGFGIYHYWFSSKMNLLQTPSELILNNKDIDIHFMFIWDNFSWKRTWSKVKTGAAYAPSFDNNHVTDGGDNGILAELKYGDEKEWKEHFDYLLKFFKDRRYIKIDNKPVFSFYQARNNFPLLKKMTAYWDFLAKENGFSGMMCLSKDILYPIKLDRRMKYSPFQMTTPLLFLKYKLKSKQYLKLGKPAIWNYDEVWNDILTEARYAAKDSYLCGFVDYDDSPRRGNKARILKGGNPEKFEKYMKELVKISLNQKKEYIFLMAWNEWGEGSYLEPDTYNKYGYLEALKRIVYEQKN